MNMRLTTTDLARIESAKRYFAELAPIPVELTTTDVVRIALKDMAARIRDLSEPAPEGDKVEGAA